MYTLVNRCINRISTPGTIWHDLIREPAYFHLHRILRCFRPNDPRYHHIVARGFAERQRKCKAFEAMRRASSLRPDNIPWLTTLEDYMALAVAEAENDPRPANRSVRAVVARYQIAEEHRRPTAAIEIAAQALEEQVFTEADYHAEVADIWKRQDKWFSQIDELQKALALKPRRSDWHYQLARAYDAMDQLDDAVVSLTKALALDPRHGEGWYRLGWALERMGRSEDARSAYRRAVELTPLAHDVGVAYFHARAFYWVEALRDVREIAEGPSPPNAVLELAGRSAAHCYDWEAAARFTSELIERQPERRDWRFRLGMSLERMGRLADAAATYRSALACDPDGDFDTSYRLGAVLHMIDDHEAAMRVWLDAADTDAPNPGGGDYDEGSILAAQLERATEAADRAEKAGDWENAALALQRVIDCSPFNAPVQLKRLGYALSQLGRYEESCAALRQMKVFQRHHGVDFRTYAGSKPKMKVMRCAAYQDTLPLRDNVILYESFLGHALSDSPRAIYDALVDDPEFADYLHVWAVNDDETAAQMPDPPSNTIFVHRGFDRYLILLASARYLINNSTFPYYFVTKRGQSYLNTWHGTPIKALGKDMLVPGKVVEHRNLARNLLQATHVLSPNPHTTHVLIDRTDVTGLTRARIAETGYPRIDRLVNATGESRAALRRKLGISPDRPVVFYAPTWRGYNGAVEADLDTALDYIRLLNHDDYQLLYRSHYLTDTAIRIRNAKAIVPPGEVDTNDILSITDVLITDYSSIFFDFLPTKRPIVFFAPDMEKYESSRGAFYFNLHDMPGEVCSTPEDAVEAVVAALSSGVRFPDRHEEALKTFGLHEDGRATERAIDFFFRNSSTHLVRTDRPSGPEILFFPGSLGPNGITKSFINLLTQLETQRYGLTVIVEPANLALDERPREMLAMLPSSVRVLGKFGAPVLNPEQQWVIDEFRLRGDLPAKEMWNIHDEAMRRERSRLLCDATWDTEVNFEGYSRYWAGVMSTPGKRTTRKLVYLHNDMYQEWTTKYPRLECIFNLYKHYDAGVSVSRTMADVNRANLAERFGLDPGFFVSVPNCIDPDNIISQADEPLDPGIADWAAGDVLFVTIGRLSPEKDHRKLIEAFAGLRQTRPDIRLAIAGDGPLRRDLARRVEQLGLGEAVLLTGQIPNPFPLLRRADCFVLPSNHEGQPMVLLEALTLGKPIVATDIPGSRHVLQEFGGLLVPNTAAGVEAGLAAFLAGSVPPPRFDASAYQANAIEQFKAVLAGAPPVRVLTEPESDVEWTAVPSRDSGAAH